MMDAGVGLNRVDGVVFDGSSSEGEIRKVMKGNMLG